MCRGFWIVSLRFTILQAPPCSCDMELFGLAIILGLIALLVHWFTLFQKWTAEPETKFVPQNLLRFWRHQFQITYGRPHPAFHSLLSGSGLPSLSVLPPIKGFGWDRPLSSRFCVLFWEKGRRMSGLQQRSSARAEFTSCGSLLQQLQVRFSFLFGTLLSLILWSVSCSSVLFYWCLDALPSLAPRIDFSLFCFLIFACCWFVFGFLINFVQEFLGATRTRKESKF